MHTLLIRLSIILAITNNLYSMELLKKAKKFAQTRIDEAINNKNLQIDNDLNKNKLDKKDVFVPTIGGELNEQIQNLIEQLSQLSHLQLDLNIFCTDEKSVALIEKKLKNYSWTITIEVAQDLPPTLLISAIVISKKEFSKESHKNKLKARAFKGKL